MKKTIIIKSIGVMSLLFVSILGQTVKAQDAEKSPLVVNMSYYSDENNLQYITVAAKSKVEGKFLPVNGVEVKLYLDKDSTGKPLGFIGKVITANKGKAATNIPPALAEVWKSSAASHTFIAVTSKMAFMVVIDSDKSATLFSPKAFTQWQKEMAEKKYTYYKSHENQFDETNTELTIAKAKITIDTAADKNVVATVNEFKGGVWVPVKGVDIKLCIRRLGGDLPINDKDSYTTDSTGQVTGVFKRDSLPGDKDGKLILVAKVEDNDTYGNLRIEKAEPWGKKFVVDNNFFAQTALWGSRFHSPSWLVFMAYSIIVAVWGTLIYLVYLLIKIKKLSKEGDTL